MEAAALSSASRVIVELTDPSNLWDTFEPLLAKHLPLRNLHWKSSTRPLRSIDALHVAITKAEDHKPDSRQGQRRHQIPGLKETPYLKIYLLRCDDNETYKETCRKQIRQWIKINAQTSDSKASHGSHEKHDAFEFLIVHVVLPDTAAASQPRTSKNSTLGPADSTDSLSSKSKWPGKSSSTIFEKLRADFSSSSKSAVERVAQIRIQKPSVQNVLPSLVPASELENQWDDLLEKLKASILTSFHIRVAQYEDDIRERDSQRHLPGWNFCTFFILKEGLALGFESVGLLEDASMIYDELGLGLDVVVREQGNYESGQEGSLLSFSKELKDKIRSALDSLQPKDDKDLEGSADMESLDVFLESDPRELPLSIHHKRYRELILANNVSSLDFRIYVFTRQLELLHRRVNGNSGRWKLASSTGFQQEHFSTLAEICSRTSAFINVAARCMRNDLYNAWGGKEGLDQHDLEVQKIVIDNIVATWSWRAVTQILSDTASNALNVPDHVLPVGRSENRDGTGRIEGVAEQDPNGIERPVRPVSGILEDAVSEDSSQQPPSDGHVSGKLSDLTMPQAKVKTATLELASSRGELVLLGRRIMEAAAPTARHLVLTMAGPSHKLPITSEGNGLNSHDDTIASSQSEAREEQDDAAFDRTAGLSCLTLRRAAKSAKVFAAMYEKMTSLACRHFLAAEKDKSADRALVDLAILKYNEQDFGTTAKFLEQVRLGNNSSWTAIASSVLEIYADCLKHLDRNEDLFYCLLDILSLPSRSQHLQAVPGEQDTTDQRVSELFSASKRLAKPIEIPLDRLFEFSIRETPSCCPDEQHGICVLLPVRSKIPTFVTLEEESCLVLTALEHNIPAKIRMRLVEATQVGPSLVALRLVSHEFTLGWYRLDSVEFRVKNLIFKHDFASNAHDSSNEHKTRAGPHSPVLIYPSATAPKITAIPSTNIDLSRPRRILMDVQARTRAISDVLLSFRPATAGFRLRSSDAKLTEHSTKQEGNFSPGQSLQINSIGHGARVLFEVPYSVENAEITELELRAEVSYKTESGTFIWHTVLSVSTILQVSVNVHDMFKANALFSRFTITPSTLVPLRLKACRVEGASYEMAHGADFLDPVDVFPKQPASWLCRFTARPTSTQPRDTAPPKLLIEFECIDEMVLSTLENQLLDSIAASNCSHLSTLLCAHLVHTYRSKWTEQDLETACLLQEVELWSFDDIGWNSVLLGLAKEERQLASGWLHEWHKKQGTIGLSLSSAPLRTIGIPIEIPTPRVVVSVLLAPYPGEKQSEAIAVGEPFACELVISQTSRWQLGSSRPQDDDLEISFEIGSPPELWLIGGNRRGTVRRGRGSQRFPLLLLPQRAGHLLLPSVEVKCFSVDNMNRRIEIACETDYASQAESVLVIPDLKTTVWTGSAVERDAAVAEGG